MGCFCVKNGEKNEEIFTGKVPINLECNHQNFNNTHTESNLTLTENSKQQNITKIILKTETEGNNGYLMNEHGFFQDGNDFSNNYSLMDRAFRPSGSDASSMNNFNIEVRNKSFNEYYHIAKNLFDSINEIRMSPTSYLPILEDYYSKIEINEETKKPRLLLTTHKYYNFTSDIKKISASFESFKELALKNIIFEPIMWSEKVFQKVNNQINEMIRTSNSNNQILFKKIIEIEYSTSKKYEYFESILLGVEDVDAATALLIFENNPEQIDLLLSHNFDEGSVICGEIGEIPYIIYYYSKKIKTKNTYNNFNLKELSLDHPMFRNLPYLDKITTGSFVIANSDKIRARFKLDNGEYKEEEIKFLFN